MDLTSDIPDFVKESFVPSGQEEEEMLPPEPANHNTFEDQWKELGKIVLGMYTARTSPQNEFAFSCIRLSDLITILGDCVTDEHNLWVSPTLAPFVRLTTWSRIRTETNFYELAATFLEPTIIFAFESAVDVPRSYFYGSQELVAIPRVVTAATFVFLLQRVSLVPSSSASMTSHHHPTPAAKKKRTLCVADNLHDDESDEENGAGASSVGMSVQSVEIEHASTNVPVTERQRMGTGTQLPCASEVTFDLHEIMSKWKRDNKRPTVEKICDTEKLTQRDVKQWLARQNTTWTKMLIQYGFRDTNAVK